MIRPVLPVYYYHDHFTEMLGFVECTCAPILAREHHEFIGAFRTLSRDVQCLLIRMINRRGHVFRPAAFRYAEIGDAAAALCELIRAGHAQALHEADYTAFLAALTKAVLVKAAKTCASASAQSTWPKPRLIEHFVSAVPFQAALGPCAEHEFIALDNLTRIQFLLYLYFGKTDDDLKKFALRDLGIMRTNKQASISARFSDGNEARACFHYSRILDRLETKFVTEFKRAIDAVLDGPAATSDHASDLRNRAAFLIGQFFDKRGDKDIAERLYRAGTSTKCYERLTRLLYANGDKASAEDLLRRLIDDPASDDECLFATDFYARKFGGQRKGACTDLLRSGRTVTVDNIRRNNPEAGVAAAMRREGWRVFPCRKYAMAKPVRFALLG